MMPLHLKTNPMKIRGALYIMDFDGQFSNPKFSNLSLVTKHILTFDAVQATYIQLACLPKSNKAGHSVKIDNFSATQILDDINLSKTAFLTILQSFSPTIRQGLISV